MASSTKICLKLLVDTKSNKVLFAEAGKEFVDFVFNLLTLPIGAVAKFISIAVEGRKAGFGNKELFAGTKHATASIGRLYGSASAMDASHMQPHVDKSELLQPKVGVRGMTFLAGYVKGPATYMVTDGLEVTPMSDMSKTTLINKFSFSKDVKELDEKVVTVGMIEGLALLEAAMRSDTVLSDAFLERKK
ncbi:uncharacterized protein LOC123395643 [Hordeum vulgare subsp. vulgare]|uniref:uncharacterized protein LOC123395643 n=1 Tax=Hordeum vulgare subsp. vulgare TaxID=112509 RepID=UPI001D1A4552|nr:uncharacterized protein LOC123395643 [Hordeum vulgare subsp. vulgare]